MHKTSVCNNCKHSVHTCNTIVYIHATQKYKLKINNVKIYKIEKKMYYISENLEVHLFSDPYRLSY